MLHDHEDGDNSAILHSPDTCSSANQGLNHSTCSNIWWKTDTFCQLNCHIQIGRKHALSNA